MTTETSRTKIDSFHDTLVKLQRAGRGHMQVDFKDGLGPLHCASLTIELKDINKESFEALTKMLEETLCAPVRAAGHKIGLQCEEGVYTGEARSITLYSPLGEQNLQNFLAAAIEKSAPAREFNADDTSKNPAPVMRTGR